MISYRSQRALLDFETDENILARADKNMAPRPLNRLPSFGRNSDTPQGLQVQSSIVSPCFRRGVQLPSNKIRKSFKFVSLAIPGTVYLYSMTGEVAELQGSFMRASCASDCSGAQHSTIAMGSFRGFPATEEFHSLWSSVLARIGSATFVSSFVGISTP